jgi:pimeloyl-ACP methyl ester carboxylesterase
LTEDAHASEVPGAAPERFEIAIADEVLEDLRSRLRRTRFPRDFANEDWGYGFETGYLRELVDYWAEEFDWRAVEAQMNEYEHFRVELDGIPLHYMYVRGRGPNSMPLLLNHGWPWTFWDYRHLIGPLTDPARHGGDPADSFDLIVPSLPGFGFSSPLESPGWNFHRTADNEVKLMTEVLGYEKFAAAGGDWGAVVTSQLGHKYPDRVVALYIHTAMFLSLRQAEHPDFPPDLEGVLGFPAPSEFDDSEAGWVEKNAAFFAGESAYSAVHATKPQTLAAALNDSPAGLIAWIAEKRRTWADTVGGDIESVWSKDDLCTVATIYWVTETIGTSARFYKEATENPWAPSNDRFPVVSAPSALGIFLNENALFPRRWTERYYNVQQYTVHERGAHFAPAEVPSTWLEDAVPFFRRYRADLD